MRVMLDCKYISIINGIDFFYQWLIQKKDREKFTIINHKEIETINIAIIKYKDSPLYIQQIIDTILRPYRQFARYYVDDIIIFFKIFEEYIEYLNIIFELFNRIGITLKNLKFYFDYSSIILLKQRINGLDITCVENYIAALKNF
jgi:hypothetical protein